MAGSTGSRWIEKTYMVHKLVRCLSVVLQDIEVLCAGCDGDLLRHGLDDGC